MPKQLERRATRNLGGCNARCEAESARNGKNKRSRRIDAPARHGPHRPDSTAGGDRPGIEVVFYKEILDHRGFPHRCEVMRVCNDAPMREAAISGAIRRFEILQRVTMWQVAADGYEVISLLTPRD
jgi:hypothetical protein